MKSILICFLIFMLPSVNSVFSQELYKAAPADAETRWISPENPKGLKASGGKVNKGAKGAAFVNLLSGDSLVMMDIKGAGIIHRMWISGTIPRSAEQRRMVTIKMYWDGDKKPAVSVPIGDFFGTGLGMSVPFENALFSNPEGRSFNFSIPMPYRTAARIVLLNESPAHALVWFDINFTSMKQVPADALYFHAYWNRIQATTIGEDYVVLPKVTGKGRFLGTNIGVIGDSVYRDTWFGEGEVKMFLDGDQKLPSLVGTGTEDYIGTGWGQGVYTNRFQGSLVSDTKNDLYCFYRFHIPDPVYFQKNCKVTLQQIGNAPVSHIREMIQKKVKLIPVWYLIQGGNGDIFNLKGKVPEQISLLDRPDYFPIDDPNLPTVMSANFYRSDDLSATAYFYLNKPASNLPENNSIDLRLAGMKDKVWSKSK
jgi:Protein of unknown function (DUF2961)